MKKNKLFLEIIRSFELIKRYGYKSIFFGYLNSALVILLVPLFIASYVLANYYHQTLMFRSEKAIQQTFSTIEHSVQTAINETGKLYSSLAVQDSIKHFMSITNISDMNHTFLSNLMNKYDFTKDYVDFSTDLDSVIIYSASCNYVLHPDGNKPVSDFTNTNRIYPNKSSSQYYLENGDNNSLYLCYNLFFKNKLSGTVFFKINSNQLLLPLEAYNSEDYSLSIYDTDGNLLMSYGGLTSEKNTLGNTIQVTSETTNYSLELAINDSSLLNTKLRGIVIMCILLSLALAIVLSMIMSLRAYNTLNHIILHMNVLTQETMDNHTKSANELLYITENIMKINRYNTTITQELMTSTANLNKMQLDTLQMQLNPHFLFNVLNTLHMYIIKQNGMNAPASRLILLLSDMLTESLNTIQYLVPLSQEVTFVKKYLDLQTIMIGNSFDVEWNVDSRLLNYYVPKLSIQPLIENSIKHGIKSLYDDTRGFIRISITQQNSFLVINIVNNGATINDADIVEMQEALDKGEMPQRNHIGIKNVNKRIKLIFGEKYGCTINNTDGLTHLRVITPLIDRLI